MEHLFWVSNWNTIFTEGKRGQFRHWGVTFIYVWSHVGDSDVFSLWSVGKNVRGFVVGQAQRAWRVLDVLYIVLCSIYLCVGCVVILVRRSVPDSVPPIMRVLAYALCAINNSTYASRKHKVELPLNSFYLYPPIVSTTSSIWDLSRNKPWTAQVLFHSNLKQPHYRLLSCETIWAFGLSAKSWKEMDASAHS